MEAKLSPGTGIVILLGVASAFASNHLCARIAFDHGAAVATGVSVRATFTALFLFCMMRVQGVRMAIPRELRFATLLAGVLILTQSYTLYSAVAIIPPALALLVFQTSPMLYVLLTWALGREKPRWSALPPMMLALIGLALDGRLRTFAMTAITAVLVLVIATAGGAQALPRDAAGFAGLALLAVFYCIAMMALFYVLPRVSATSTGALNFEPIALLVLTWLFLGHTLSALQILGALVTVSAIAWLGMKK